MSQHVDGRPINVSLAFFQVNPLDHFMCPYVSLILNGQGVHSVRFQPERVPNVSLIMVRIKPHVRTVFLTERSRELQRVPTCPNVSRTRSRSTCPVSLSRKGGTRTDTVDCKRSWRGFDLESTDGTRLPVRREGQPGSTGREGSISDLQREQEKRYASLHGEGCRSRQELSYAAVA